jgi:branched-chain amino acid transport system ATP-binding protein
VSSLSISNLSAGYGQVRVIEDLSMNVQSGETVALLGTNGNGKSTLMRCIMGLLAPTAGSIKVEIGGTTHELAGAETEDIVALGVVMVPEGRRLFPRLSVEENLTIGASRRLARKVLPRNIEFCFEAFRGSRNAVPSWPAA